LDGFVSYSAPEYDLSKLQWQLKLDSGVNVALCFNSIQDGIQAKTAQTKSHIKAIHMEVKHNIFP